ncbi:SCP2 sterol-binding domain-containing protein [Actinocorallia sp. A-T 12471]|uniref:SCP2 sterol-binding domain-containing protein n=1 Tax=Actinocorallia sp. A-T 12471 TaxID=3089813 RepID=UPI0029CC5780|nr:SCP2 sterol-binding domain-containing protein [Actinocorallia sp. A-T 12471]MDX6744902.1 SCP2 sterol-binding domain-containing protein [Actinocorallia sp. A-T 12471]
MATEQECVDALDVLARRLGEVDPAKWAEHAVNRSVSCHVSDLGLSYATRITSTGLAPFEPTGDPRAAQVRLTMKSADLLELAADKISPAKAWATGRLKIEASVLDLIRLRKIL